MRAAARLDQGKPAESRDSVIAIRGGSIQGVVGVWAEVGAVLELAF
jgi:hypothetical protein